MRSLAIAVDPPLLGSSLAAVFGPLFDVVVCVSDTEPCEADVAIVNGSRLSAISAGTVISLPDIEGNSGLAFVQRGEEITPIEIGGLSDLLRAVAAVPT